jgi:ubiquitin C-terminal hydrolase
MSATMSKPIGCLADNRLLQIAYSLSSVVLHVGTSGHDGHYQAVVLCGERLTMCNDQKVNKLFFILSFLRLHNERCVRF